jgi:outer membrane protein OmpA-like peptidoglycan-associated protein
VDVGKQIGTEFGIADECSQQDHRSSVTAMVALPAVGEVAGAQGRQQPVTVGQPLNPKLREAGVTAVINGYASTPGTAEANYVLSFERATAVARWLDANDVPESALVIVGHGATDTVGSGTSDANRRVLVVIEEPTTGA